MQIVTAYKCTTGDLETDPKRAFAWELVKMSETAPQNEAPVITKVDFNAALWIIKNKNVVKQLISEYEREVEHL